MHRRGPAGAGRAGRLGAALLLLALAGCEGAGLTGDGAADRPEPDAPSADAAPDPSGGTSPAADLLPVPQAGGRSPGAPLAGPDGAPRAEPEDVPDIYMALQQASDGLVSVVFAIDAARDNTPSDDAAIRLTPENGLCNPQELRRFAFPDVYAARPVFSAIEAEADVGASDLPAFMATAVSTEMIRLGLAAEPDDTRPQNICTYKLWERLLAADRAARLAGQ